MNIQVWLFIDIFKPFLVKQMLKCANCKFSYLNFWRFSKIVTVLKQFKGSFLIQGNPYFCEASFQYHSSQNILSLLQHFPSYVISRVSFFYQHCHVFFTKIVMWKINDLVKQSALRFDSNEARSKQSLCREFQDISRTISTSLD